MLKTQLNVMIKKKKTQRKRDTFLVGCTDHLPHPGSTDSSQWRNSKYLDSSSVFNPVQSVLTRRHEISHLHPAPPWHHLYKEPVLDPSLKYALFSSDGTLLHLRVNVLPPNLLWAGTFPPQYLLRDPDPCRSWESKDNFTVWRAPRIHKFVKKKPQKPNDSTGWGSFFIFFTG